MIGGSFIFPITSQTQPNPKPSYPQRTIINAYFPKRFALSPRFLPFTQYILEQINPQRHSWFNRGNIAKCTHTAYSAQHREHIPQGIMLLNTQRTVIRKPMRPKDRICFFLRASLFLL